MPTHKLLAIFLSACIAGCTALNPGFETPNVAVSYFKPVPGEGAVPQFEIGLRVSNPNAQALKLAGIAYTIEIEGKELIKGVGNELPTIAPYGEEEFVVTASVGLMDGLRLLQEMMNSPKDLLSYSFKAKLDPGLLQPAIRVTESGEFSLRPQS
jgi:LEA14-like dessication related protein